MWLLISCKEISFTSNSVKYDSAWLGLLHSQAAKRKCQTCTLIWATSSYPLVLLKLLRQCCIEYGNDSAFTMPRRFGSCIYIIAEKKHKYKSRMQINM
jgi:hypothetical protein